MPHIKDIAFGIHHPVDAGSVGQALDGRLDDLNTDSTVRRLAAIPLQRQVRRLFQCDFGAHSGTPATSGVSHARCCPPSSAII